MLLLYIFIIVMIFSSVPHVITLTRRAASMAAVRRVCERAGFRLKINTPLWYTGTIRGKKCSFQLISDDRIIAVKVIGFLSGNTLLNFIDHRSYSATTVKAKESTLPSPSSYKVYKKEPYDFKWRLSEEERRLPLARVILISDPYPIKITCSSKDGFREIHPSDEIGEGEIHSIPSFTALFK